MKKLIDAYAGDKGVIKYHIIDSEIEVRTRMKISAVIAITSVIVLILLIYLLTASLGLTGWLSVVIAISTTFGSVYFIDKLYMQRFSVIGELRFLKDRLEIHYYNPSETEIFPYDTIVKVQYCGDIVKTHIDRYLRYMSFLIKITLTGKKVVFLKVKTSIFLDDTDEVKFSRSGPHLEVTLDNIPSKSGTFENKRLHTT